MAWTNWTDWLGSKPPKNYNSVFIRRSVSRINELKKLNYSEFDIIQKLSQEYSYISMTQIENTVKKIIQGNS